MQYRRYKKSVMITTCTMRLQINEKKQPNMCTVTLSYDDHDSKARQQIETLLASGMFTVLQTEEQEQGEEFPGLDYPDSQLWEDDGDMPPLPEGQESFTPEEAYQIIMSDIRKIYAQQ